jgi:hypothetical protein
MGEGIPDGIGVLQSWATRGRVASGDLSHVLEVGVSGRFAAGVLLETDRRETERARIPSIGADRCERTACYQIKLG